MPSLSRLFRKPKTDAHTATTSDQAATPAAVPVEPSPQGLRLLFEGTDPIVDIVAVHGLNGHREKTWAAENGVNWLVDLLPRTVPNARIMAWGYDANTHSSNRVSCQYLYDHARSLVSDLCLERQLTKTTQRPIIFVAHSLGGLVVKSALIHADAARKGALVEHRSIMLSTYGIVFMGTPHQGGSGVSLGKMLVNIASVFVNADDRLLKHLERDSEWLQQQLGQYAPISGTFVTKFAFEEYQTPTLLGHSIMVVPRASAVVPGAADSEAIVIHADHIRMVKFASESDSGYKTISGHLRLMVDAAGDAIVARWATEDRVNVAYSGGNTPSVHCLIPFPENLNFTGREVVLADIKRKLFVERDCRSLAIVGLGGVGKTQVALRMAYWTQQNQPDYSIFWIPALSPETIVQQCAEIVAELRLTKIQPNEDSRMTLRRYLSSSQSGQWLLIVDNVDDVDILDVGYTSNFKFSNRNGVTLFTTRHTEAAVSLSGKHVVELQRLTQEEGLTLLGSTLIRAESSGRQDCEYEIDLLEELDFHPLAITQAVAYINTKHILVPEYLGLLKNTEQSLVKTMSREFRDDTRYPASKNAVATTWLVSFEQIRVMDPLAADIMCFFSQVGSKAVPRPMLPKGNSEGEDADAGEETTSAMGTLMSFAFITRRSTRHLYDMHRLVHLATRIWIQKDQRTSEVNHKAVRHLSENFPNSHYKNRKTWQEWLPHAIRLVEDCKETGLEEKYSLCRRIGLCLYEDGRYEECLHFILEHYKWNRIHLEENTPIFLEFQHYLAKVYIENSQTAQAIDMLEQVVAVRKRTTIEDDTALLDSQHELARAYRHRGEFSKAINLMEHVVLVRQKSLPEVDPDLLASQHVLALLEYYHADRAPEGMRLMEHIVAIEERTLQKDDPNRLLTQHELACMYFDIDRPDCAKKLLESVVANYAQTLDEEHPHRLVSEDLLARVCLETQDIPKATLLAEHVVRVRERTLSVTDPKLSKSQYGLARAYLKGGHLTRAVEQLRHVVKVRSAICEDDTLLLLCQQQLASIYLTERKVGTAIQLLQHVVKMRAKMLSEDNASRLVSEYNLAHAYLLGGNARDAIPLLQHVVAIEATRLDEDDRSRLVSQKRLADPYFAGGMLCEAIALADHVYTVRMRKLGKDHEDVDDSQLQLQQFRETANTVAKESVDGARGEMNS